MTGSTYPPKFCPRCGAFYRDLSSSTCPQCFAHLEVMDQEDAVKVENVVESLRDDAEYVETKAVADEKYKEQAFGGCLAVIAIAILTIVVSVVIVYTGMHRKLAPVTAPTKVSFDRPATVVPEKLAGAKRTALVTKMRSATIPFTVVRATYGAGLDVFAAPAGLPPTEHEAFKVSTNLALDLNAASLKQDEIVVHGADYIVLSHSVEQLRRAVNELAQ